MNQAFLAPAPGAQGLAQQWANGFALI